MNIEVIYCNVHKLQIEAALWRNNSLQKLPVESVYRLQHGLLLSSSQQVLLHNYNLSQFISQLSLAIPG